MSLIVPDDAKANPVDAAPQGEPAAIPEHSPVEWGFAILVFSASVLYLWPFRRYTNLNADEGIVLAGAQRVLAGQVPYRDFFSFYTPGSYYLMALLFRLFGASMLVGRGLLLFIGGVFSALSYLLARRVCSRWSALLCTYLLLTICLPSRFFVLHNWDSTFWAYVALYATVRLVEEGGTGWAFATGGFLAATLLTEQSKGVGLALGLGTGLLAIWHSEARRRALGRRNLVALAAGAAWPVAITLAYFARQHSLSLMMRDCLWPLHHYSVANRLPYGYSTVFADEWQTSSADPTWQRAFLAFTFAPCWIVPVLPFLGLGWGAFHALDLRRRRAWRAASGYYTVMGATIAGLLLATVATGRADLHHLVYIAPPLFVALAWILDAQGVRSWLLPKVQPLLVAGLLVSFTAYGLLLMRIALQARYPLETRRGLLYTSAQDHVLPYINRHVPPGAEMLVFPYQPLYSFLSATVNPTHYDYLQPGMHTAEQFQDLLHQLAREQTPVVLFDPSFASDKIPTTWPATPVSALARDPVADYILSRYRLCKILTAPSWRLYFMVRRDLSCPAPWAP